jgi:hypothetical protein
VDDDDVRRPIVINLIQFVQNNKGDVIVQRIEASGGQSPGDARAKSPGKP